jgi:hypothetical protein
MVRVPQSRPNGTKHMSSPHNFTPLRISSLIVLHLQVSTMMYLFTATLLAAFLAVISAIPVSLGTAGEYAILAGAAITSAGSAGTVITGKMGIHPGTSVTGFGPGLLIGDLNIANAASLTAKNDLELAVVAAMVKTTTLDLTGIDLGGMTLVPGVYSFASTAAVNGVLTLDAAGDHNAEWIFKVGSALLFPALSQVWLINGAAADHGTNIITRMCNM